MRLLVRNGVMAHRPAWGVYKPEGPADEIAWGKYVVDLGHCHDCHSLTALGPSESHELAGGFAMNPGGVGRVYPRNLTPDPETGLGRYSAEQIKQAIRNGKRLDGKPMVPPMSSFMPHISGLTDEDLDALVAYLRSVKPIKNKVPERRLTPEAKKVLGE